METSIPRFREHPDHIQALIHSALKAADPEAAVRGALRRDGERLYIGTAEYSLGRSRIFLVGAGKASVSMGVAAWEILGDVIMEGILTTKDLGEENPAQERPAALPESIRILEASHPVSDNRGIEAAKAIERMLAKTTDDDLVLCLISGGASALMTLPIIPLDDWQHLVSALLASGCTINELNTVRRQIDTIKGGGLLKMASPAACASLILSDVVGNPLEVIGSGPTVTIEEDPEDARIVLNRYGIAEALPGEVWKRLDSALGRVQNVRQVDAPEAIHFIVGDVELAALAAAETAGQLGFSPQLLTWHLEGEAREVGKFAASLAMDARPGTCLILGGETTVTLRGSGHGGRNQETVLAAAIAIDGVKNVAIASFATDGEDGPTTSAGAFATGSTLTEARCKGLVAPEILANNDSNPFFAEIGGLLDTGPTGTNVNDLLFMIKYEH
jgi:glycerate 2-kinase